MGCSLTGYALRALCVAVSAGALYAAAPEALPGEICDDFQSAQAWEATNPNAPAKFSTDSDILTITDLPGGKATWGASVYRTFEVDLDRTPWLVVSFVGGDAPFSMTLVNLDARDKRSGAIRLRKPGLGVLNLREAFGWKGRARIATGLYAHRSEGTVRVDWLRYASKLRPEEERAPQAAQPRIQAAPHHGLDALAARKGWRRLEDCRQGDAYLSERAVFVDSATGHTVWRMTDAPGIDFHKYYDIPVWNADGSQMLFVTARRGKMERWIMQADGSRLRPVPCSDDLRDAYWHPTDPRRLLYADYDRNGPHIRNLRIESLDSVSGQKQTLLELPGKIGAMQPPHPSGRHFLFGARDRDVDSHSTATVVSMDGAMQALTFERRWHRLRFTNADDLRIFFNFDAPRTQWTILPDGSDRHEIPDPGSHPGYLSDGSEMTYFADAAVWAVGLDGKGKRLLYNLGGGGHGSATLDRDWFIADTYHGGPAPTALFYFTTDGKQTGGPVFVTQSSILPHTARWHPYSHSTHPHPITSPDGTKAACASDMLGSFTDLYVAILRRPDPPRNLKATTRGDKTRLDWQAPRRARELRGYRVYARPRADGAWSVRTTQPIADTAWEAPGAPEELAVTAVEHSGLESDPVFADPTHAPARFALELAPPSGLRAASPSPGTIRLGWDAQDSGVAYYDVYRSEKPDFEPSQATLVASPPEPQCLDWALPHGTAFWYRVVAVDAWGNRSRPSPPFQARTMPFEPVEIVLPAAAAQTQGMRNDGKGLLASGPPRQARAQWTFDLPRDGLFALWGRNRTQRDTRPTIHVVLDGTPLGAWRVTGHWERPTWSAVSANPAGGPALVRLAKGSHSIALEPRDKAAVIIELRIVDDPTYWPLEDMNRRR